MPYREFSGIVLILLLTAMLMFTLNVQRVEASGSIIIRGDGSIDPPTANITSLDNVTYTFTDDNYDEIIVERDNIVVDGAGYTLQGSESGNGILLWRSSNVTIKNMEIITFKNGIALRGASNSTIVGNTITGNYGKGIYLYGSSNNSIAENNITNNWIGIMLFFSPNNNITRNVFADEGLHLLDSYDNIVEDNVVNGKPLVYLEKVSGYTVNNAGQVILMNCTNIQVENLTLSNRAPGVQLWGTTNSHITKNNIMGSHYDGIYLHDSSNISIVGNNITNCNSGIYLRYSSNNGIAKNNIANNMLGIELHYSNNNTFVHNNLVNNYVQVLNFDKQINVWDNGYEGNYWSNYYGTDVDLDGIGDTPNVVDQSDIDNYPLMNPYWNPCDVNHDLTVGMKDIGIVAKAYGSQPGDSHWNPHADITGSEHLVPDGKVEMRDMVLITRDFGYGACITLQS